MILRQIFEHFQQGDRIPADGPAPELRRKTRDGVGPFGFFGFVPAVVQQAGGRILRMLLHEESLEGYHGEIFAVAESFSKLHGNRAGHVQAVQPHLIRVMSLVPESSRRIRRPRFQQGH
ncbi:hypothetical protein D3C77_598960 [compost metagenome]